ncbi:hypothetical protein AAU61_00415 [Desulfocarbo indianensis]|nr:hypothetical protein AAU61_00415 [Desulfocarbo indianensis]
MISRKQTPLPLPIWPGGDRYPRRGVWRGSGLVPPVRLRTTARLRPGLAEVGQPPLQLLLSVTQAASAALKLHPRLNFFNFDGRMRWAGPGQRVAVVMENQDLTCDMVVVREAHEMGRADLAEALLQRDGQPPQGLANRLRQTFPAACFRLERWTRYWDRQVMRHSAPVFISMLGLPGIEEVSFTPTTSLALYPGWPQEGRLPLTLCFSHQYGNARPLGRFLLTVRDLLE